MDMAMRWERGTDFVAISSAHSTDVQGAVWHVETSLEFKDLPIELRAQVPKTDDEGYQRLVNIVSKWAEENGYQLVTDDAS